MAGLSEQWEDQQEKRFHKVRPSSSLKTTTNHLSII